MRRKKHEKHKSLRYHLGLATALVVFSMPRAVIANDETVVQPVVDEEIKRNPVDLLPDVSEEVPAPAPVS